MPFDLFGAADPGAAQAQLCQSGEPAYHHEETGTWLLTGNLARTRSIFGNTQGYSNASVLAPICPVPEALYPILSGLPDVRSVITLDPPEHTRRRKALEEVFPQRSATVRRKWLSLVVDRVDAVVAAVDSPRVDLKKVAVQIALEVLCEVAGLPLTDQHDLGEWTTDFAEFAWSDPAEPVQRDKAQRSVALWDYCVRAVEARVESGDPGPGILGDLLRYRGDDGQPWPREVVAVELLNLIGAGWTTTADAICHTLARALAEPGCLARLTVDDSYLDAVVAEALRLDSPIGAWPRLASEEVFIGDVMIERGSNVLVGIAGANRDEQFFGADPDRFDPSRPNASKHLAFGFGDHRCLGKHLALLVITTAVRALARHVPDLQLDPDGRREKVRSAVLLEPRELLASTGMRSGCPVAHTAPDPAGRSGSAADGNG